MISWWSHQTRWCWSKPSRRTMLRSWWAWFVGTKRGKVAISSPSINYRRRVLTSSPCSLWILKCDKTVTLGSPSVLVCNNNSFKNLSELLKVPSHGISLSLPSQPSDKYFGECCVIVLPRIVNTHHLFSFFFFFCFLFFIFVVVAVSAPSLWLFCYTVINTNNI